MKWTAWPTRPVGRVHSCETGWRAGVTWWPCYCRVRLAGHCRFCQRENHWSTHWTVAGRCACLWRVFCLYIFVWTTRNMSPSFLLWVDHVPGLGQSQRSHALFAADGARPREFSINCDITFYLYFLQSSVPFLLPDSSCFSFLPSFSLSTYGWNVLSWSIRSISFDVLFISGCEQCDRSLMVAFSWRTDKLIITNFFSFFFFFFLCLL